MLYYVNSVAHICISVSGSYITIQNAVATSTNKSEQDRRVINHGGIGHRIVWDSDVLALLRGTGGSHSNYF